MSGYLVWSVFVDTADEKAWRETLGQADIDAWCEAHGWQSTEIASGSVNIYCFRDGKTEVTADLVPKTADGKPLWDPRVCEFVRRRVSSPLKRSLPEGIGTVIR